MAHPFISKEMNHTLFCLLSMFFSRIDVSRDGSSHFRVFEDVAETSLEIRLVSAVADRGRATSPAVKADEEERRFLEL